MTQRIDLVVNAESQDLQKLTQEMSSCADETERLSNATNSINLNSNTQQLAHTQQNNSNNNLEKALVKETETSKTTNTMLKELITAVKETNNNLSRVVENGSLQTSGNGGGGDSKDDKNSSNFLDKLLGSIGKGGGLSSLLKSVLPAAGAAAGVALGIGIIGKEYKKTTDEYENRIPNLLSLQSSYGTGENYTKNTSQMDSRFDRLINAVKKDGTGYKINDYIDTQLELANYGFSDNEATDSTSRILKMQAGTNANRNALIEFEGLNQKYGNNTSTALIEAYSGLVNSGMQKGQFTEFLQGLQTVMEEGISKGFVRSAKDIASDMALLSALSDNNPLWQGKQATEKMQTISSGLESATGLNSVSDVLLYSAFYDSNLSPKTPSKSKMINTFMLMEQGLTKDTLPLIYNAISGLGYEDQIEMLKGFGLNYTGATQLHGILDAVGNGNYASRIGEINKLVSNPDFQSKERDYTSALANIETTQIKIGETAGAIERAVIAGFWGTKEENKYISGLSEAETKVFAENPDMKLGDVLEATKNNYRQVILNKFVMPESVFANDEGLVDYYANVYRDFEKYASKVKSDEGKRTIQGIYNSFSTGFMDNYDETSATAELCSLVGNILNLLNSEGITVKETDQGMTGFFDTNKIQGTNR